MNNLPRVPKSFPNTLTTDWKLDIFLEELNKRSIEFSLGVDGLSKSNTISFNIRHRTKDKALIQSLLKAIFGTVKQG